VRIVVVGSIVADTIEGGDGTVVESLGGIAHSVAALAALAGDRQRIVPLCRLGADCRERVERWAARLPGVTLEAIRHTVAANPKVRLSYPAGGREGERSERLIDPLPPLRAAEVAAVEGAELALVNCIGGNDCTAAAMRRIRGACPRVYLDVHSLALGRRASGERFYRPRKDWPAWLDAADVVQCNLAEAATICGVGRPQGPPVAGGPSLADERFEAAIEALLRRRWGSGEPPADGTAAKLGEEGPADGTAAKPGEERPADGTAAKLGEEGPADGTPSGAPRVLLLTRAAGGATVFWRSGDGLRRLRVAAPKIRLIDPTGAGDACGAGYVAAWLAGATVPEAARAAVRSGSAACASRGVPELEAFRAAWSAAR
jgi:sugar/nucleoside kinase (ribokinase family)